MKITKSRLKQMIREGIRDEYKQFQTEVGVAESGWKKKMTELDQRQQSVNSIKSVHTAISEIINYFNGYVEKPIKRIIQRCTLKKKTVK